jgi:hypothetical protein
VVEIVVLMCVVPGQGDANGRSQPDPSPRLIFIDFASNCASPPPTYAFRTRGVRGFLHVQSLIYLPLFYPSSVAWRIAFGRSCFTIYEPVTTLEGRRRISTMRNGSGQAHSTIKMPIYKEANTSIQLPIYSDTPI